VIDKAPLLVPDQDTLLDIPVIDDGAVIYDPPDRPSRPKTGPYQARADTGENEQVMGKSPNRGRSDG